MLIYHMTNNEIICTQIILGASKTDISHGKHVWAKHKGQVQELRNNGKVFVTGGTYKNAVYSGKFEDREKFERYIK